METVIGITIDGFVYDDLNLAIEDLEEEYGFEVEDWSVFLGGKSFESLYEFLVEDGIYSELIYN